MTDHRLALLTWIEYCFTQVRIYSFSLLQAALSMQRVSSVIVVFVNYPRILCLFSISLHKTARIEMLRLTSASLSTALLTKNGVNVRVILNFFKGPNNAYMTPIHCHRPHFGIIALRVVRAQLCYVLTHATYVLRAHRILEPPPHPINACISGRLTHSTSHGFSVPLTGVLTCMPCKANC